MKVEIVEDTWVPEPSSYHLTRRVIGFGNTEVIEGFVVTKRGVVGVYQGYLYLLLDFVWGGRHHRRRIKKVYTKQYIVTLARRFAEEKSHG